MQRSTLSSGARGNVGLYVDMIEAEMVAIKTIPKMKRMGNGIKFENEMARQRILNEIEAMKRIEKHDNIVRVRRFAEDRNYFYVIMEYVCGEELFKIVNEIGEGLSERASRRIFVQLLSALEHLHKHGIYHRDIKLENVMYDGELDKVTLIDFGMCYVQQQQNKENHTTSPREDESGVELKPSGSANDIAESIEQEECTDTIVHGDYCGTKEYASPEVLFGRKYDGVANDIWALGTLLFVMIYHRYPFSESNRYFIMDMDKHPRIEYILKFQEDKDVSDELKDLITQMMQNNYKKRISIEQIKLHPWLSS